MGSKFGSIRLLFHVLFVLQCTCSINARENFRGLVQHGNHHHHSSSQMDGMDPSVNIFFTLNDLTTGKQIPVYFSTEDPSTSPHLLPREEADSIPFSTSDLPHLLRLFSFAQGSPQGLAVEETLKQCEVAPMIGETKFCATSLESMMDSAHQLLGLDKQIKVLNTNFQTEHKNPLQNYTILNVPKEVSAHKMVACHTMPYPYAVYYCHSQTSENRLFRVSLDGEDGEKVDAAAVCHMDTSHWNTDHPAFRVLKIRPGDSPVCHFFPADNLVWFHDQSPTDESTSGFIFNEFLV